MKLFRHYFVPEGPPYIMSSERDALPFDIEKDKWQLVNHLPEADIVPVGNIYLREDWVGQVAKLKEFGCTSRQLLLIMNIFDECDTYDWLHWYNEYSKFIRDEAGFKCVLLTNNKRDWRETHNQFLKIPYDLMFNRQKAYMTETDKFETGNRTYFYFECKNNFKLNPIQKLGDISERKIALCPNRIMKLNARSGLRRILRLFMENKSVILSDPTHGYLLEPEDANMTELMKSTDNNGSGLWMPIANRYYEQTYISMYIETCTISDPFHKGVKNPHQSVTEKTFDPLIKGHFILPFGYAGIIRDIKDYGFKLPHWINYTYDDIECDRHRFAAFLEEADRLLKLPLSVIENYYVQDFEMLIHNRQLFWSKPYVPLYDQVLDRFNKM